MTKKRTLVDRWILREKLISRKNLEARNYEIRPSDLIMMFIFVNENIKRIAKHKYNNRPQVFKNYHSFLKYLRQYGHYWNIDENILEFEIKEYKKKYYTAKQVSRSTAQHTMSRYKKPIPLIKADGKKRVVDLG